MLTGRDTKEVAGLGGKVAGEATDGQESAGDEKPRGGVARGYFDGHLHGLRGS